MSEEDDTFICQYCQAAVPYEEAIIHTMTCVAKFHPRSSAFGGLIEKMGALPRQFEEEQKHSHSGSEAACLIPCDQCGVSVLFDKYAEHMALHEKIPAAKPPPVIDKVPCEICGQTVEFSEYENHARTHQAPAPSREISKSKLLKLIRAGPSLSHKEHAADPAPYVPPESLQKVVCATCGKSFRLVDYNEHLRSHAEEKPEDGMIVQCKICEEYFSSDDLDNHMKSHLPQPIKKQQVEDTVCEICLKRFKSSEYAEHAKTHVAPPVISQAPKEEKKESTGIMALCGTCGKNFMLSDYSEHIKLHEVLPAAEQKDSPGSVPTPAKKLCPVCGTNVAPLIYALHIAQHKVQPSSPPSLPLPPSPPLPPQPHLNEEEILCKDCGQYFAPTAYRAHFMANHEKTRLVSSSILKALSSRLSDPPKPLFDEEPDSSPLSSPPGTPPANQSMPSEQHCQWQGADIFAAKPKNSLNVSFGWADEPESPPLMDKCEICGAEMPRDKYAEHVMQHEVPSKVDPQLMLELPGDESQLVRTQYTGKGTECECTVCCMEYTDKDGLIYLPCAHFYHETCILNWFHKCRNDSVIPTCPICLKSVFKPSQKVMINSEINKAN